MKSLSVPREQRFCQDYRIEGMSTEQVKEMILSRPVTKGRIVFLGDNFRPLPFPMGRAYALREGTRTVAEMVTPDDSHEYSVYIEAAREGVEKGRRIFEDIFKKILIPIKEIQHVSPGLS